MHYRPYGTHDLRVSEIGLGGHREGMEWHDDLGKPAPFYQTAEERARLVGAALDRGVNYCDTTVGWEQQSLGESLRWLGRRDAVFVSGCRIDFYRHLVREGGSPRAFARRWVETHLRAFGFPHFDQFLLGALDADDALAHDGPLLDDAFDELDTLRAEGKFRFLAFSTHDPDYAARVLARYPVFDAVMTPYNFANRAAEGALQAELAGVAWIAMKTLVWQVYGIPVTVLRHLGPLAEIPDFDPAAPIATLAHRFVLQHPRLTTCVPAMTSLAEVAQNTAASGAGPLTTDELRQLDAYAVAALYADHALLALGGLFGETVRIRHHALSLLHRRFALEFPPYRLDEPDAVAQVWRASQAALAAARADERLAPHLVNAPASC